MSDNRFYEFYSLAILFMLLVVMGSGLFMFGCINVENKNQNEGDGMGSLSGKRIAMIIAPENYRDEEFQIPYEYFKEKGAEVDVFSTRKGTATGMLGGSFEVEKTLDELNVDEYDAIVFVGGSGTPIVRSNDTALKIAKEAAEKGKVLGAICWSPTVLAKAGVLKGKRATVWLGDDPEYGMKTSEVLEKYGAVYTGEGHTIDGNIVTAKGPRYAEYYAKDIEKLLTESSN